VVVTVREPPTVQPASADEGDACHLRILVDSEAAWSLDAESAVLHGNVAHASHGETVHAELVGQGDAARTFQRFALKKNPLTYLPAPVAAGVASTLQLSVGGIRWSEVAELYGQPPNAAVAELRHDADGNASIQAGDGVFGALLPTGAEVRATYRVGSGLVGRVAAESLTTLLQRPPGVTEVRNPLAAEGGADPETLETARLNAPRGVRTFGRIVSIQDFEDQVTLSGEVAKALAVPVWDGLDQAIHLTVAAQGGTHFSPTALADLGANLETVRDPNHRLRLDNYVPVFIELRGGIGVAPAADAEAVLAAARQAVLEALSFDAMSLGQAVNLSDMYRVIQDVPGVRFVDIDRFLFKLSSFGGFWAVLVELWRRGALGPGWTVDPVQSRLHIFAARPDPAHPGSVLPAELAAVEQPDEDVTLELREG
jgi:predicted phage baseplate assembly protein